MNLFNQFNHAILHIIVDFDVQNLSIERSVENMKPLFIPHEEFAVLFGHYSSFPRVRNLFSIFHKYFFTE